MKWHGNGNDFDRRSSVEITPAVIVTGLVVAAGIIGACLYIGLI